MPSRPSVIEARRRDRADLPRADGRRHGRDLSDYERAAPPAVRQTCGRDYRCQVQRRVHRRVHRARVAGGAGGRPGRQAARWRRHRDRDRPDNARRYRQPDRRELRRAECLRRIENPRGARRCGPISPPTRRFRTTRVSGRRFRMRAAARGAAPSTTPTICDPRGRKKALAAGKAVLSPRLGISGQWLGPALGDARVDRKVRMSLGRRAVALARSTFVSGVLRTASVSTTLGSASFVLAGPFDLLTE